MIYPKVYYCVLLQIIKCYNPEKPSQTFKCELYESSQQTKKE
ncbi:MAG: hypothetical protein MRT15_11310 [archaeon YNP-LCB-003-016]|nr:hypothetical protein [Candidatus Culexarchaeum yellowstonense]